MSPEPIQNHLQRIGGLAERRYWNEKLGELAKDLSYVWHGRSTTNAERENLLRILMSEVVLSPVDVPERAIHIQMPWRTGTCSELSIARRPSYERATSPEAIKLIGERRRCARCAGATA